MCPNCEMPRNILSYKHFEVVEKYADELNVVLKCSPHGCGHVFSPGLSSEQISLVLQNDAEGARV